MEVDDNDDIDGDTHYSHNTDDNSRNANTGLNAFESFATPSHTTSSLRRTPNTISFQTPTKFMVNQARRSSSGFLFTSMFSARYRHLQKLHSEAFLGLNSVCLSSLPVGAVFRSSLPATPVATPIARDSFTHFTEQAFRDRLCRTPSPRHGFVALALHQRSQQQSYLGVPQQYDHYSNQMDSRNDSCIDSSDVQPMDVSFATSPTLDEPLNEDDKDSDNANCSAYDEQHYYDSSSNMFNNRHQFVGNISYRVRDNNKKNY